MPLVKKLVFAFPFLLTIFGFYQTLNPIFANIYLIFDFKAGALTSLLAFLILLLLTCFFFIIFATLAQDIKITLPVAFLGSLPPLFLISPPLNFTLTMGLIIIFALTCLTFHKKMSTYLTFKPITLLIPSINQLAILMVLVVSLSLYLAADSKIKVSGFELPESLLDTALTFNPVQGLPEQDTPQSIPTQISPGQIELLRQNPELLAQYGLDPKILDSSKTLEQNLIKAEVKKQFQSMIGPYTNLIPVFLAGIFFLTMKFGLSVLSLPLTPVVWFIFWIMEKIGFTTYTTEMREVKKLVV